MIIHTTPMIRTGPMKLWMFFAATASQEYSVLPMIGSSNTLPNVMIKPVMPSVTQTIAIVQCA